MEAGEGVLDREYVELGDFALDYIEVILDQLTIMAICKLCCLKKCCPWMLADLERERERGEAKRRVDTAARLNKLESTLGGKRFGSVPFTEDAIEEKKIKNTFSMVVGILSTIVLVLILVILFAVNVYWFFVQEVEMKVDIIADPSPAPALVVLDEWFRVPVRRECQLTSEWSDAWVFSTSIEYLSLFREPNRLPYMLLSSNRSDLATREWIDIPEDEVERGWPSRTLFAMNMDMRLSPSLETPQSMLLEAAWGYDIQGETNVSVLGRPFELDELKDTLLMTTIPVTLLDTTGLSAAEVREWVVSIKWKLPDPDRVGVSSLTQLLHQPGVYLGELSYEQFKLYGEENIKGGSFGANMMLHKSSWGQPDCYKEVVPPDMVRWDCRLPSSLFLQIPVFYERFVEFKEISWQAPFLVVGSTLALAKLIYGIGKFFLEYALENGLQSSNMIKSCCRERKKREAGVPLESSEVGAYSSINDDDSGEDGVDD